MLPTTCHYNKFMNRDKVDKFIIEHTAGLAFPHGSQPYISHDHARTKELRDRAV